MTGRRGSDIIGNRPCLLPRRWAKRQGIRPMDASGTAPSDVFLEKLVDAMLAEAAETGWTRSGLERAGDKAGLSRGQALLAAPNGIPDILDAFGKRAARAAGAALTAPETASLKIREKVRAGVKAWLAALSAH